jgi:hypothetical protein
MIKNLRTFKTGIIFCILLFSLFAVFVPKVSAALVRVEPLIIIESTPADENVIPNSGVIIVKLKVYFKLTGIFAPFVEASSLLRETTIGVHLDVEETDPWIDANLKDNLVQLVLGDDTPFQTTIQITVTEQAPAFKQGEVKIRASSPQLSSVLFSINEYSNTFKVPFVVGYWPLVTYELKKGNLLEIGPLDTAEFPIEIENLGNGPTYVAIELIDIPEGEWSANVDSSVILSSAVYGGEGIKKTVNLVIKPPYGFGFHKDIENFKVRFTPSYVGKPGELGQVEVKTFTVQSVGLSPGAGFEIPLIVVTVVIIGFVLYWFNKRRKK